MARGELRDRLRLVDQVVEREQPRVLAQLLVEELLQRQRALAFGRVLRVQRGLGVAALERGDDGGRVPDRLAVEGQDGERLLAPAREPEGDRHVRGRHGRPAGGGHALVVQRPAHLLAVVRRGDVPEHGRAHWRHSATCSVPGHGRRDRSRAARRGRHHHPRRRRPPQRAHPFDGPGAGRRLRGDRRRRLRGRRGGAGRGRLLLRRRRPQDAGRRRGRTRRRRTRSAGWGPSTARSPASASSSRPPSPRSAAGRWARA